MPSGCHQTLEIARKVMWKVLKPLHDDHTFLQADLGRMEQINIIG